jgi:hypothetical protein
MGLYILDTDTLRKGWAVAGSVARRRGEKKLMNGAITGSLSHTSQGLGGAAGELPSHLSAGGEQVERRTSDVRGMTLPPEAMAGGLA